MLDILIVFVFPGPIEDEFTTPDGLMLELLLRWALPKVVILEENIDRAYPERPGVTTALGSLFLWWILIDVDWRVSRSSTHSATGNRCSADLALIIALTSVLAANASLMAILN